VVGMSKKKSDAILIESAIIEVWKFHPLFDLTSVIHKLLLIANVKTLLAWEEVRSE
jgi:hypothetical protein